MCVSAAEINALGFSRRENLERRVKPGTNNSNRDQKKQAQL